MSSVIYCPVCGKWISTNPINYYIHMIKDNKHRVYYAENSESPRIYNKSDTKETTDDSDE